MIKVNNAVSASIKTNGKEWFVYARSMGDYGYRLVGTGGTMRDAVYKSLMNLSEIKADIEAQEAAIMAEAEKLAAEEKPEEPQREPALSWSEMVGGADDPSGGE